MTRQRTKFREAGAKGAEWLGYQLDRFFFQRPSDFGVMITDINEILGRSVSTIQVRMRASEGMRVGHLVSGFGSRVAVKADNEGGNICDGFVHTVLDNGDVLVAPQGYCWLALDGNPGAGMKELYLGRFGLAATTAPSGANTRVQKIGKVLAYNGEIGKYLCSIDPDAAFGGIGAG
jgi:hypothetical protein